MADDLLTAIDGAIARVTFNRPQARNAITADMVSRMGEFVGRVASDPDVRCLILSGQGDHFMAGGDISGFGDALRRPGEERRAEFVTRVRDAAPIFTGLLTMPKPVIASVRGACAGAGVGFAACCDFVLASDTATFLVAHIHIGASPDGATTYVLPRKVGLARAMDMAVLGKAVTAPQALAAGLVNQVHSEEELDTATETLAKALTGLSARAVANTKKLINESLNHTLDEHLEAEAQAFADCAAGEDFVEGVTAFAEKRRPEFNR